MIRFLVTWEDPSDQVVFEQHYRDVHIPLGRQLPGLRRYTVSRDMSLVRGERPYHMVSELDFDDVDALRAAFASPQGQATGRDVDELVRLTGATVRSVIYQVEDVMAP